MRNDRVEMREQSPEERIKNFEEVALGLTEEEALNEAERCMQCKNAPCRSGCPIGVDIPGFIRLILQRDFGGAVKKIKEVNSLPAVCGRVCPQETQCEGRCALGKKGKPVAIGALERFVADWEREHQRNIAPKAEVCKKRDRKIAVVGSGPAGLTAAADLSKAGYDVTIFEALHEAGGVLVYGIPEFRLPKAIVKSEVKYIESLGVKIMTDYVIGKIKTIDELLDEGYEAVFIGTGAGLPKFLGIPGEHCNGVYFANEFLIRVNLMKAYLFPEYASPIRIGKRVAVIGGGNVAIDCARCALRLGAEEVTVLYRRSYEEMPARRAEIKNAVLEGVKFKFFSVPTLFACDERGWVKAVEYIRMEPGEVDDVCSRKHLIPIEGTESLLEVDSVVIAIGQTPNRIISQSTRDILTSSDGVIIVDPDTGMTAKSGVFAGGDAVTGSATVISAIAAGKRAANGIINYLNEKSFKVISS